MDVVVVLAGIVEELRILAVGLLDDLLERQPVHAGLGGQLVAVVDIGLVVLVVVILERLLRHVRLQRLVVVGKIGKGESHGSLLGLIRSIETARRTTALRQPRLTADT